MTAYTYEVLYPFTAEDEGELSINAGEVVHYFDDGTVHPEGWMLVQNKSLESGFVPAAYVQFLKEGVSSIDFGEDKVIPQVVSDNNEHRDDSTTEVAFERDNPSHNTNSPDNDHNISGGVDGIDDALDNAASSATQVQTFIAVDRADAHSEVEGKGSFADMAYVSRPGDDIREHSDFPDVGSSAYDDSRGSINIINVGALGKEEEPTLAVDHSSATSDGQVRLTAEVQLVEQLESTEMKEQFVDVLKQTQGEDGPLASLDSDPQTESTVVQDPPALSAMDHLMTASSVKPYTKSKALAGSSPKTNGHGGSASDDTSTVQEFENVVAESAPQPFIEASAPSFSLSLQSKFGNANPNSVLSAQSIDKFDEYKSAVSAKKSKDIGFKPAPRTSHRMSSKSSLNAAERAPVAVATSTTAQVDRGYAKGSAMVTAGAHDDSSISGNSPIGITTTPAVGGAPPSSTDSLLNISTQSAVGRGSLPPMQLREPVSVKLNNVFLSKGPSSNSSLYSAATPVMDKKNRQHQNVAAVKIPVLTLSFKNGGLAELVGETELIFEKLLTRQKDSAAALLRSIDEIADGVKSSLNVSVMTGGKKFVCPLKHCPFA